jgi:hypothetical protein
MRAPGFLQRSIETVIVLELRKEFYKIMK